VWGTTPHWYSHSKQRARLRRSSGLLDRKIWRNQK